ncbi:type II secretion system protein GspL [Trinickia terrae]|uniref:Type II secretion system protein GspL n=1 Tax=Trinickia terrae TaxID=2571161 RepID=A0A4U1HSX5_9BURK|nr:type II secretion system protein GspL [Trinickia terrae]TKC83513.1 type II secretion system protein GspL [Trinickia terrae]
MSTLIVFLPPRDPVAPSQEWLLPEMAFLLLDKGGRTQRAGRAALALLPRASSTVLVMAARDVLMLRAAVPPLKGPRLRQALPNVVEDQLIQDPQTCHIALDPQALADGERVLAVIDRGWFRFVVEAFGSAGHRNLRAVPVTRCLPTPAPAGGAAGAETAAEPAAAAEAHATAPIVAAVLGMVVQSTAALFAEATEASGVPVPSIEAHEPRVEFALARGAHGEGLAVPASAVGATLAALAGGAPVTLYELTDVPGSEPRLASIAPAPQAGTGLPKALPLPFETLARRALECRLDLCQFEFEARPWRLDRATLRRLRLPVMLAVASVAVAVVGMNVQWLMLARQRDALNTQMTELLLNAFPKTTVVLDAPEQMTRQLDQLRIAAGELSPNDFLSLAAGLAHSLGPVPVNGVAALDYHDRRLDVTFKPETKVDPDFTQRLARNGLTGAIDSNTGKWTIRNGQ